MIDNVALDVVIGLVFIYLLYSLFATILMEIISSSFETACKKPFLCATTNANGREERCSSREC